MSEVELYDAPQSTCSQRVRYVLNAKGIAFDEHKLDLFSGDQLKPEYLSLNPNGVVPTLVDGETVVIESSVILQYIDEIGDGPRLMPDDRALKAETLVWLLRCVDEGVSRYDRPAREALEYLGTSRG